MKVWMVVGAAVLMAVLAVSSLWGERGRTPHAEASPRAAAARGELGRCREAGEAAAADPACRAAWRAERDRFLGRRS